MFEVGVGDKDEVDYVGKPSPICDEEERDNPEGLPSVLVIRLAEGPEEDATDPEEGQ